MAGYCEHNNDILGSFGRGSVDKVVCYYRVTKDAAPYC
jgi:hypothetical protein